MSHILYITPYYPPEKGATAVCISEPAKRLVKLGHHVTVLTTVPNYPTGIVQPEYRGKLLQREVIDGVEVVRVWSYTSPSKGFLRRILAQLSFGCLASFIGKNAVGHPDVLIVHSPPLFDFIAARIMARFKHCPFILMIGDLWPESAVQFGVLRNRWLIRFSEWLEWSTYRKAGLVWVVTEGVRNLLVQRGLPPKKVFYLPNGVDTARFCEQPKMQARTHFGWDERFTVLYAGTHGLAQGLKTVLEAAELLQKREDIHFVLAGDGGDKEDLVAYAQSHNLTNVTFMDAQLYDKMPLLYAASDLCLVPMRKVSLLETTIPVKTYEIMACGRPMLLGADGQARQLAEEEAGAAMYVEPENPTALASAIEYMSEHPAQAQQMGQNGRAYVQANFAYDSLTATLNMHIETLLGNSVASASKIPISASSSNRG